MISYNSQAAEEMLCVLPLVSNILKVGLGILKVGLGILAFRRGLGQGFGLM